MRAVDGGVRAELILDDRHEGAPGLAHGGAVAAALDDLFGGLLVVLEAPAVTANLSVDFRRPVALGARLELSAHLVSEDGRKLEFHGVVESDGIVLAQATALFVRVDISHFESTDGEVPAEWRQWGGTTPSDRNSRA